MATRAYRTGRRDPAELEGRELDWSLIKGVFRLARPYWPLLTVFGIVSIIASVIGVIPPLFFRMVIDDAIPTGNLTLLVQLSFAAIGMVLLRSCFSILQTWNASQIGNGLTFDLRTRVYNHVHDMPMTFFTRSQTGAIMSRVNNDVSGAQQVLTEVMSTITSDVFGFISTVVIMFALDWRLTLVVLAAIPGFLIPAKYMGRVLQRVTRQRFELLSNMNVFLQERLNVAGAALAKLFGSPQRERDAFHGHAKAIRDIGVRMALIRGTYRQAMNLYTSMSEALMILFGGWLVITGGTTLGTVIAFRSYANRAYGPINSFASTRIQLMTATVSFERVFEILAFANPITDRPGATELQSPRGRVEFRNVSFAYPTPEESTVESLRMMGIPTPPADAQAKQAAATEVLHDVSFAAEPGQMLALVGPTGAGKTTTLSLVPRLYDVTAGSVLIDGVDVRDFTLESVRRSIGFVSQDPHLFHDTIRNNLLYAKPDATQEELERACRIARIHDLIASLPEGYDTVAGDRGYRLSGGEKQRVAIARMILKDPAIVILDEATSHLDSENERLIKEALDEALQGRTTLAIAHRLSTVMAADQILVLDRGGVVEQGRHDELVDSSGLYRTLYDTQFDRVAAPAPSDRPARQRSRAQGWSAPQPSEAADALDDWEPAEE